MIVVCKMKGGGDYYNRITPEKEYLLVPTYQSQGRYYVIYDDNGSIGMFLKEYFYTTQELRERVLGILLR